MINKIAAGEVEERPASVIKELVENALDAGATYVDVTVEGGGSRLIRIVDNGAGIHADDLRLAVSSHATSKISAADDLFAIQSLGFRGEALASVAAVSHLRLASRPKGATGAELKVDGGRRSQIKPVGMPDGTTIEVGDLFFNVPARRAFLRTERGELRAALEALKKQALARPDVSVRATADGKVVFDAPACDEPRERIAQLLGRELAEDLIAVPISRRDGVSVRGYTTSCDRSRGDSRQQYFFLNGRVIRDVTLLMAVKQAYANLLPPRRHPSTLLWLEIDPQDVDVNVHPQKSEVRFRRDREVFRQVLEAVRAAIQAGGLVPSLPLPRHAGATFGGPASSFVAGGSFSSDPQNLSLLPGANEARGEDGSVPLGRFLQVHRRYVVEETSEGVRIIDPHALHERILYEGILERLAESALESQRFLFPQVVDASPDELLCVEARSEELTALGFEVAPFGANAIAVYAAPRLLKASRVGEALGRLLRDRPQSLEADEESAGLLHDLAASLACRAAVRFGQALPDDQVAELLSQRSTVRRGHCCPHGRPTALALSLDDLDTRFGRQGAKAP